MKDNLSIAKKAKLLKINRSTIYYQSCKKEDVGLMNEIRDLYEKHCFLGYRRITEILNRRIETKVNRKKVLKLMRKMGLVAVYPKRKLSNRREDDSIYPYLLKEKLPLKPNDCWAVDITYIRVCEGYAYLTALIDCVSRRIMGWSLSPFLDVSSCLEALNEGLKGVRSPSVRKRTLRT